MKVSPDGHLQVPILNRSSEALNLPKSVSIGSIKVLPAGKISDSTSKKESTAASVSMIHTTSSSSKSQEWLASTLKMSQALTNEKSKLLLDCAF